MNLKFEVLPDKLPGKLWVQLAFSPQFTLKDQNFLLHYYEFIASYKSIDMVYYRPPFNFHITTSHNPDFRKSQVQMILSS